MTSIQHYGQPIPQSIVQKMLPGSNNPNPTSNGRTHPGTFPRYVHQNSHHQSENNLMEAQKLRQVSRSLHKDERMQRFRSSEKLLREKTSRSSNRSSLPLATTTSLSDGNQGLIQRSLSTPSLPKAFLVNRYLSGVGQQWTPGIQHDHPHGSVQLTPGQEVIYGGQDTHHQAAVTMHAVPPSAPPPRSPAPPDDLVYLAGPLTEHSVVTALQTRYTQGQRYTSLGPVLLALGAPSESTPQSAGRPNTDRDTHNTTLTATTDHSTDQHRLQDYVSGVLEDLRETGVPQSIVVNGYSSCNKTVTAHSVLHCVLTAARLTTARDTVVQRLDAVRTVLDAFGRARSDRYNTISRMSQVTECLIEDGVISKISHQCFLLDHSRVTRQHHTEGNFVVFEQLVHGLSPEERDHYRLSRFPPHSLRILQTSPQDGVDTQLQARLLSDWKTSLSDLGIPSADIIRILAAILLLGNVGFHDGPGLRLEVTGEAELHTAAALLEVTVDALTGALTTRSRRTHSQVYRINVDAHTANSSAQALAQALYSRTVAALVKRANSQRSANNRGGSFSSQGGDRSDPSPPSSRPLHTRRRPSHSGVTVLDMMGYEHTQTNGVEQLCANLCWETLQHFYNTIMFSVTEEGYVEEGIQAGMDVYYSENGATVELISSQKTGLLSLLEAECLLQNASPDSYLQKVRIQHLKHTHFQESRAVDSFMIRHYAGPVQYSTSAFIHTNRQLIQDDIVWLFDKRNCSFGFVSHLFSHELRCIQESGGAPVGNTYKLTAHHYGHGDTYKKNKSRTFLSEDLHHHLDSTLHNLVKTKPNFVQCIQINAQHKKGIFNRELVVKQLRAFHVLETLHVTTAGFLHKFRYKVFTGRYRLLCPRDVLKRDGMTAEHFTQSKCILDHVTQTSIQPVSTQWALGNKHVFISEPLHQLLEQMRSHTRQIKVTVIQAAWRGHRSRVGWPRLRQQLKLAKKTSVYRERRAAAGQQRSRSLSGGSVPLSNLVNGHHLRSSMNEKRGPPPIPAPRAYTILDNRKICYPQLRAMTDNYAEPGVFSLSEGREVKVTGLSLRSGHVAVEHDGMTISVPHHITAICDLSNQVIIANV